MKNTIKIIFLSLIFFNCSDDDLKTEPEPVNLSEEVVVYNPSLFENSYVFAIENGGTKSYLLNKEGFKVKEWNFASNLGNDIEILPDGKLLGMFKSQNPVFNFGGYGGIIRILN